MYYSLPDNVKTSYPSRGPPQPGIFSRLDGGYEKHLPVQWQELKSWISCPKRDFHVGSSMEHACVRVPVGIHMSWEAMASQSLQNTPSEPPESHFMLSQSIGSCSQCSLSWWVASHQHLKQKLFPEIVLTRESGVVSVTFHRQNRHSVLKQRALSLHR